MYILPIFKGYNMEVSGIKMYIYLTVALFYDYNLCNTKPFSILKIMPCCVSPSFTTMCFSISIIIPTDGGCCIKFCGVLKFNFKKKSSDCWQVTSSKLYIQK